MQFKRGWGTDEGTVRYFNYNMKKASFSTNGVRLKSSFLFFKFMPTALLKLAGAMIYKHVG
jgi:hypothetical protein